jgi:hypothetical protein
VLPIGKTGRVLAPATLWGGALAAVLALACRGGMGPDSAAASAACPEHEPISGDGCSTPIGKSCGYSAPASRQVHCHCVGDVWDCGTPLGIDVPAPSGCPLAQPANGASCPLPPHVPAYPGDTYRSGCFYEVAMSVPHECVCVHHRPNWLGSRSASWDCGQIGVGGPPRPPGACPERKPPDDSLCAGPMNTDCQYGYNLTTTCRCVPTGGAEAAWGCKTVTEPPSPH